MYKQGTVVLTPFPFTDLSGDKVRPAVVVSNNTPGEDVVVVFVTSKSKAKGVNMVSVSPSTNNGIKVISTIVCSKIATLNKKVLLGELGVLSEKDKNEVLKSIKIVLGL